MEDTVYVGFTSFRNERWISFGPPTYNNACGHRIGWQTLPSDVGSDWWQLPQVQAVVQLRQRIIVRTGKAPNLTSASLDDMLLKLVQEALKHNLV